MNTSFVRQENLLHFVFLHARVKVGIGKTDQAATMRYNCRVATFSACFMLKSWGGHWGGSPGGVQEAGDKRVFN